MRIRVSEIITCSKSFSLALVAACSLLSWSPAIAQSTSPSPERLKQLLAEGDDLSDENMPKAIAVYRKAATEFPDVSVTHEKLGNALALAGNLDDAEEECRRATQLDDKNGNAHSTLAWILGRQQHFKQAIVEAQIASQLDPTNPAPYSTVGLALTSLGDSKRAVQYFEYAIKLDSSDPSKYLNLGAAMGRHQDFDGAIQAYSKALELNPKSAAAHLGLGNALGRKGDLNGQIEHFRKAAALAPNNATAHGKLGASLGMKGDWAGAMKEGFSANVIRLSQSWNKFLTQSLTVWASIFLVAGVIFAGINFGSRFKPQAEEEVIKSFFLTFYRERPGRLVITTRRLVYVPEFFSSWFGSTRVSIERDQVKDMKFGSSIAGGSVDIQTGEDIVHHFTMPHLVLEPLKKQWEDLQAAQKAAEERERELAASAHTRTSQIIEIEPVKDEWAETAQPTEEVVSYDFTREIDISKIQEIAAKIEQADAEGNNP